MTRRALLTSLPLTAMLAGAAAAPASAEAYPHRTPVGASAAPGWISGVCDDQPDAFGTWRGSTVAIVGLFGDASLAAQLEQWQFANSAFSADVDLAVGGPIDHTWAQVAAGSEVERWKQLAAVLRDNWHYRTVSIRYAHEANGTWMPWSVAAAEVPAFRTAFRLFAATIRSELAGHDVRIAFAPNFGTWPYSPNSMWPGNDVVDVVGLSIYEWTLYDTAAKWKAFVSSSIGPATWLAFAKAHGKPLAFSEWGGQSAYFIKAMHDWIAAHAGTGPGQLLYEVYLNGNELLLTGATAGQYRALRWGR